MTTYVGAIRVDGSVKCRITELGAADAAERVRVFGREKGLWSLFNLSAKTQTKGCSCSFFDHPTRHEATRACVREVGECASESSGVRD